MQPEVRPSLRTRKVNKDENLIPAPYPSALSWHRAEGNQQEAPNSWCAQGWTRQAAHMVGPEYTLLMTKVTRSHVAAARCIPLLPLAADHNRRLQNLPLCYSCMFFNSSQTLTLPHTSCGYVGVGWS